MKHTFFLIISFLFISADMMPQNGVNTDNFEKSQGLLNYYYDEAKGKIYLEVEELGKEFLYVYSLSSGIGSNDIGLDRGQLGNEQVVYFKKAGNKLLLIQPNLKFRAITQNELEKKSVQQAFAKSVIYGAEIVKQQGNTYLIDITEFLMRDAHGVTGRLKRMDQGSYNLDKSKSALNLERTKAFPKNVEFDVILTGRRTQLTAKDATLAEVSQGGQQATGNG